MVGGAGLAKPLGTSCTSFMSKMDGGLDVVKGDWGVGVRFKDGIIEEEACRIKKSSNWNK